MRREKAIVNQHILEFKGANESVVVSIKGLESFPQIEERSSVESLSNTFRRSFVADDFIQDLLEEEHGLFTENIAQIGTLSESRFSLVQDFGISTILGSQKFRKVSKSINFYYYSTLHSQKLP